MKKDLKELLEFTEGCREDMHEPDEQDLSAMVIGDHLDNAFGNQLGLMYKPECDLVSQEFVVVLKRNSKVKVFNLATLIALARKAKL